MRLAVLERRACAQLLPELGCVAHLSALWRRSRCHHRRRRRRRRGSAMPIDLILCHGTSLRPFSSERLVLFNDDSGGVMGGSGGGVLWTRFFLLLWLSFYSARLGYLDKL